MMTLLFVLSIVMVVCGVYREQKVTEWFRIRVLTRELMFVFEDQHDDPMASSKLSY